MKTRTYVILQIANRCHNASRGFRVYGISFKRHIHFLFFFRSFANGSPDTFPVATTEWLFTADVSSFLRGELFQHPGVFSTFALGRNLRQFAGRFPRMEVNRNTYCCTTNADGSLDTMLSYCFYDPPITLTHVEESVIVAIPRSTFVLRVKRFG